MKSFVVFFFLLCPFYCDAQDDDTVKISVGASFDFFNKQSKTDLYFDLTGHKSSEILGTAATSPFLKNIGIDFKLYQARVLSQAPDTNQATLPSITLKEISSNEVSVGDISFSRSEKVTFEDLGVNINPTYKFSSKFYGLIFTDLLIRSVTTDVNFFNLDTSNILTIPKEKTSKFPSNYQRKDNDIFISFGAGILWKFEIYSVKLKIKPVIALTQYARQARGYQESKQGYNYHPSFTCDLQLLESKSGIKLGVLLRDFDLTAKDIENPRSQTTLSLYLSKQFDVIKFAEFFNSK